MYEPAVIPLRYLLLMSTMIPLSIQITMDSCKWFYALWIANDTEMTPRRLCTAPDAAAAKRELEQDGGAGGGGGVAWEGAVVRNSDIVENLGQVSVLLTDKTGTLTENVMVLKACSIAGKDFREHMC
jgi:phospholipid-translocating ATPase